MLWRTQVFHDACADSLQTCECFQGCVFQATSLGCVFPGNVFLTNICGTKKRKNNCHNMYVSWTFVFFSPSLKRICCSPNVRVKKYNTPSQALPHNDMKTVHPDGFGHTQCSAEFHDKRKMKIEVRSPKPTEHTEFHLKTIPPLAKTIETFNFTLVASINGPFSKQILRERHFSVALQWKIFVFFEARLKMRILSKIR